LWEVNRILREHSNVVDKQCDQKRRRLIGCQFLPEKPLQGIGPDFPAAHSVDKARQMRKTVVCKLRQVARLDKTVDRFEEVVQKESQVGFAAGKRAPCERRAENEIASVS
jgi:hypothetical protein